MFGTQYAKHKAYAQGLVCPYEYFKLKTAAQYTRNFT
jgi:hypothetical protein